MIVGNSIPRRFGSTAVSLHWTIAILMVVGVVLGLVSASLAKTDPQRFVILSLHKSIGVTVFAITCARVLWRLSHQPPKFPAMGQLQRVVATATHVLLYFVTLAMPLSGYIFSAARGRVTSFFWLFEIPREVPLDQGLSHTMEVYHRCGQYAIYALVGLHVAAALHHHFVLRDCVLQSMWPTSRGMRGPTSE